MAKKLSEQNKLMMSLANCIFKPHMKEGAEYHLDIHPETQKIINEKGHDSILFTGIHRSFWEASGFTWIMSQESTKTPYTIMGDNLPFRKLAKKTGIIVFERPKDDSLSEGKRIKIETQQILEDHLARGDDIVLFAGGGRTYDGIAKEFGDIGFRAATEATKQRPVYIVPFVVDYRSYRTRELELFVEHHINHEFGSAQKPKIPDWINFFQKMDELYVRIGFPIKVEKAEGERDKDRKVNYLRAYVFENALKLTKILPENVMALARHKVYADNPYFGSIDEKINAFKSLAHNLNEITDVLQNHKELCEIKKKETWNHNHIVRNSITPYKFPSLEDRAWSAHFTNHVKYHYEKIGLLNRNA